MARFNTVREDRNELDTVLDKALPDYDGNQIAAKSSRGFVSIKNIAWRCLRYLILRVTIKLQRCKKPLKKVTFPRAKGHGK